MLCHDMMLLPMLHTGLDLWKRNLQLLVPFLIQPDIQLLSLKPLDQQGKETSSGPQQLQVSRANLPAPLPTCTLLHMQLCRCWRTPLLRLSLPRAQHDGEEGGGK